MKSIAFTIMSFCLAGSLFAQDRRQLKQQITDLSIRIERDAPYSDADTRDLLEARDMLRDALRLVNNRGGGNSQVYKLCINFAYDKYKRNYNDSQALTRAQTKCRSVADMDILNFLYEKHYRNTNASGATDLATEQSDRRVEGKLELIQFAYEKHYRNTNSTGAANKAVENARLQRRNRGTLACYQQYYPIHYRTNNATRAMDLTAETCSQM